MGKKESGNQNQVMKNMNKKTNPSRLVQQKIDKYNPKGGLCYTAKFFLALCEVNHISTKEHVEIFYMLLGCASWSNVELEKIDPKHEGL